LLLTKSDRTGAHRHVNQIGDHSAGRGRLSGAATVEKRMTQRVPIDADRIKTAAHFGQHIVAVHERRVHAERQSIVWISLGNCQELNHIAQIAREADVGCLEIIHALDVDVALGHDDVKRQARQQRQFLSRIATRDIESWIGFGKARLLRFSQRLGVSPPIFGHTRENDVAGSIDDPQQRINAVSDQSTREGVDDRDASPATGLEGDDSFVLSRQGKELFAPGRQETFVGGDDRFAQPQGALDALARRGGSAHQFDDDLHLRVVDGGKGVDGNVPAAVEGGVFDAIAHHDVAEIKSESGAPADQVALPAQNIDNAAADDAASEKRDADGFSHGAKNLEHGAANPKSKKQKSSPGHAAVGRWKDWADSYKEGVVPPPSVNDSIPPEFPDPTRPASATPTEGELEQEAIPLGYETPLAAHDPYAALRYRDCRLFMVGWVVAIVGSQIQSVAIGWELFRRTHSSMALGWVGLVQGAPVILLSIPAGQLADKLDRRKILIFTQSCAALCSIGLALLSIKQGSISFMYGVLGLGAVFQAFGWPARSALLTQTVPTELLANATTWSSSGFQVASVVGPALGGFILLKSVAAAYLLDASCQATYAFVLWLLVLRPTLRSSEPANWRTVSAGVRFVRENPLILAIITLDLFAVLLGGATYLLPAFADQILHVGAAGFGWLRAAPAFGAFGMAMFIAHRPPMQRAGRALLLAVGGFGLATIVFGFSKNFWLSLAMLGLTGAFDNVSVVVRHTLVQVLTPDEMRGRVSAVNNIFIGASNELGGFESGATARFFGPIASVIGGGIGTIAVVLTVMFVWPEVRKFGSLQQKTPQYTTGS
jgi:MFS family permease